MQTCTVAKRFGVVLLLVLGCGDDADPMLDAGGDGAVDAGLDAGLDANFDASLDAFDAGPDALTDSGVDADDFEAPNDIFFVGNSFTFGGPVPVLVHDLAVYAGFPEPNVEYRALGGRSLRYHREDETEAGAPSRVAEGWDVVVLQDFSTRPTDSIGDPEGFKEDATWFHDLARESREHCRVILYETWARRFNHGIYPGSFADPADMQAQLRTHYFDAAENYIPLHATMPVDVAVAPAGDAWAFQLAMGEPPRLHDSDDYHAGANGAYLNALVIYSTIYRRRALGQTPLRVDADIAAQLQVSADAITGETRPPPAVESPLPIPVGATMRLDIGPTFGAGWTSLTTVMGSAGPIPTDDAEPTNVHVTAMGFDGTQTGGRSDNALGWPGDVSSDTLWVGTFDGHEAALDREGMLVVRGLIREGVYRVTLFASRTSDDSGRGRLTRYEIGDEEQLLEVSDNIERTAVFDDVRPDELGEVRIRVTVAPSGSGRFAYVGALIVERTL